jgi:tetratricopeptide (TPR) repeat protein
MDAGLAPLPAKLRQAVALHQHGRLPEARALYEEILDVQPAHFDALHLLGVIAAQSRDPGRAVELIGRAIQAYPRSAPALCNRGSALHDLGRWEEALADCDHALGIDADYPAAHFNRGNALQALGRLEEAVGSFDRAIALRPDFAEAHFNRGNALHEQNRLEAALASYDSAIAALDTYPEAHSNRGLVLKELGRLDAALASYDRALAIEPNHVQAHFNRGNLLKAQEKWDAAAESYARALAIDASLPDAHCQLGHVLRELGRFDAAIAAYDAAIARKSDHAESFLNRGIALKELGRLDEALGSYDRAISIRPEFAEGYCNRGNIRKIRHEYDAALSEYDRAITLEADFAEAHFGHGVVLHDLGRLDEAAASYDRAIAAKPDHGGAYFNRSLARLLGGDLERGWPDYEWRFRDHESASIPARRPFAQPLWLGEEPIAGRTLLLHCEQGLGDTIQFCRYAKLAARSGARVILEVQPALRSLLANLEGPAEVIAAGQPLPPFELQCPLLSLPLAFKTSLSSIPAEARYLSADATKVRRWQEALGPKTRPRIGLVWSGNPEHKNDRNRSIPLAEVLGMLPAGFHYVSLQKELRESDRGLLESSRELWQAGDGLVDFSDTAALCECLDVVLCVDTSVAHLSAALGRPTWVLLPLSPDWRWLLHRSDSPWYPSATLYRQERRGDWHSVLKRVGEDLAAVTGVSHGR